MQGSIYGGDPSVNVIVRKYEESYYLPNNPSEKWRDMTLSENMEPFAGYEVTQPQSLYEGAPHNLKGQLITNDQTVNFTYSGTAASFSGNYILANAYAAPIFINNLSLADFTNLEATVYLYNSGSRGDWIANGSGSLLGGTMPGQYISVPINVAGTLNFYQIPSMSAFLVRLKTGYTNGDPISFRFRYETVKRGALTAANEPMRVKTKVGNSNSNDLLPLLTIDMVGANSTDRVYLIEKEGTTPEFDDGWDGRKYLTSQTAQIFAANNGKRYQVNTSSGFKDTYLGFRSGGENEYKLIFSKKNIAAGRNLIAEDLATGISKPIEEGTEFTFQPSVSSLETRFRIREDYNTPTDYQSEKSTTDLTIYYHNNQIILDNQTSQSGTIFIYNAVGEKLTEESFGIGRKIITTELSNGIYIVKAKIAEKETIKKIIR